MSNAVKDPQIVTLSKLRIDGPNKYLDFEIGMGCLVIAVTAKVPGIGERFAPVSVLLRRAGRPGALSNQADLIQSRLRVGKEAEYLIIPIDLGIIDIKVVAKVSDEGEPDAPVYANFKLPPPGTSLVQTEDGKYPFHATHEFASNG